MFLAIALLIVAVAVMREEKRKQVLAVVDGIKTVSGQKSWQEKVLKSAERVFPSQLSVQRTEQQLRHAGRPFGWKTAGDLLVVRTVLAAIVLALFAIAENKSPMVLVIGLSVALLIPNLYIWNSRLARQARIRRQLRPFTMMLALLMGTGIRMDQALHESIQTATGEFRRLLEQMEQKLNFQSTLLEAFTWLADEVGMKEIDRLLAVIEQNWKNGTPLAELLHVMIEEYDEELENKLERMAQAINLKVTMIVLFLVLGPALAFELIIAGINFMEDFNNF